MTVDLVRLTIAALAGVVIVQTVTLVIVDRGLGVTNDRWVARGCLAAYAVSQFTGLLNRLGQPLTWPLWLVGFANVLGVVSMGWALWKSPRTRADRDTPRN